MCIRDSIFASTLCGLPNMIGSFLNLDATKHPYWTCLLYTSYKGEILKGAKAPAKKEGGKQ